MYNLFTAIKEVRLYRSNTIKINFHVRAIKTFSTFMIFLQYAWLFYN